MRSAVAAIISVSCILLVHSVSLAQRGPSALRGILRVSGNASAPEFVRIQLEKMGMTVEEKFVYEDRFEFSNLESGLYTVVATAPGFETARKEVFVPAGFTVIALQAHRQAVQPAAVVSVWDLKIPESARRQYEAARNNLLQHNCTDAIRHLKKAVHRYAQYGAAHKAMGECYAEMNQLEMAEQEFKLALEQPHTPELHLLLGKIYQRQGNRELLPRQLKLYGEEKPNTPREQR